MEFREPQRVQPAIGLEHAAVDALLRALALGVIHVVDASPIRQVHAQQQARGLVVIVRLALPRSAGLDLQVPKARAIMAVLNGPGLE
ncbi:MAG: hypothetical protein AUJ49_03795 [Desulfovibrionaceae bacterium CG1_02_65_16]|nr:MAG: hypothetical protein AUJ49_03795 [Desulfovibrionaceae bacterium CG1_02_65_16]